MYRKSIFAGLMLAIGVVACAGGGDLGSGHQGLGYEDHDGYGQGQSGCYGGHDDDGYGYDDYGYDDYGYDDDGYDACGFDEEGLYHPCPCVTNIEDYYPCGFDEEGVYHSCPIACPEEGTYEDDGGSGPLPPPPSIPVGE